MGLKCSCEAMDCSAEDKQAKDLDPMQITKFYGPGWYYLTQNTSIRKQLDVTSDIICTLDKGTRVHLKEIKEWSIQIDNPVSGFIPFLDAHSGQCTIVLNEESEQYSLLNLVDKSSMPLQYNLPSRSCSTSLDYESAGHLHSEDIFSESFDHKQFQNGKLIKERYHSVSSISSVSNMDEPYVSYEGEASPTMASTSDDSAALSYTTTSHRTQTTTSKQQSKTMNKNNNNNQKKNDNKLYRFDTPYRRSNENCAPQYYDDPWSHHSQYQKKSRPEREFPNARMPQKQKSIISKNTQRRPSVENICNEQLSLDGVSKMKRASTVINRGIQSNTRHQRQESSTLQLLRQKTYTRPSAFGRDGFLKSNASRHIRQESNVLEMLRQKNAKNVAPKRRRTKNKM